MTPVGKMGIPAVRERLKIIAAALANDQISQLDVVRQIRELIPHLVRNRPAHTRSKGKECPPVTEDIEEAILLLHARGWSSWRISVTLGVNSGRVSEVLHGLR